MHRQRWLGFVQQELLESLWDRFPEEARRQVTEHYARLLARMLAKRLEKQGSKETADET